MENPSNLAVIESILHTNEGTTTGNGIIFSRNEKPVIVKLEPILHRLHAWEGRALEEASASLPLIRVVAEIKHIPDRKDISFILGFRGSDGFCLEARILKEYAAYIRVFEKNLSSLVTIA